MDRSVNPAEAWSGATPKVDRAPSGDDSSIEVIASAAASLVYGCSSSTDWPPA
jgi:hypothetical protein